MNFNVRKVFSVASGGVDDSIYGIITQSDGSHLFGFSDGYLPQVSHWFRSIDQGENWSTRTPSTGSVAFDSARPANCPSDIAVFGTNNENGISAAIYRSADNANSWTRTGNWPFGGSIGDYSCVLGGITTYNKGDFLACGQFTTTNGDPTTWLARSLDKGQNWTKENAWASTSTHDRGTAICAAGNGRIYVAINHRPSLQFEGRMYRSDDDGASWTACGAFPLPSGHLGWTVITIAAVTRDIIVCGGVVGSTPTANNAALWYSSDAGASWTLIPKTDVASWPGGSGYIGVGELKRLSRWLVVLGHDQYAGSPQPLLSLSADGGQTYPIAANAISGSWPSYGDQHGTIVRTRNGNLLIPVWGTEDYNTSEYSVWIGTITP